MSIGSSMCVGGFMLCDNLKIVNYFRCKARSMRNKRLFKFDLTIKKMKYNSTEKLAFHITIVIICFQNMINIHNFKTKIVLKCIDRW